MDEISGKRIADLQIPGKPIMDEISGKRIADLQIPEKFMDVISKKSIQERK